MSKIKGQNVTINSTLVRQYRGRNNKGRSLVVQPGHHDEQVMAGPS